MRNGARIMPMALFHYAGIVVAVLVLLLVLD
jgi:hypothetical protein